jgi:pyruvate,water dikinase
MPLADPSALDRSVEAIDAIEAELALISGDAQRVAAACSALRALRDAGLLPDLEERLAPLAPRTTIGSSDAQVPLLDLLHEVIDGTDRPWRLLEPLLASRDRARRDRAMDHLTRLVEAGRIRVDDELIASLGTLVESVSELQEPAALRRVHALIAARHHGTDRDALVADLYARAAPIASRRLAARLLDLSGELPLQRRTRQLLGRGLADFLAPFLAYTRATHLDLLDLAASVGVQAAADALLESLQRAERRCGPALFGEIAGEIGWAGLNAGLDVSTWIGVSVAGSFPLLLEPAEAALVLACDGTRKVFERFQIVAHGLSPSGPAGPQPTTADVARFRASNLRHAEMLPAFLDIAPLTPDRVRALVEQMDRAVEDFQTLFGAHAEECAAIGRAYTDLRAAIERELASHAPGRPVGATATRLVQMFEDPGSPGEIRTLHGCKRYLHQRGLQLGFGLVERALGTNRTATVAVAADGRVLDVHPPIEYADFEPREGQPIPLAVRAAVRAFGRHALHGVRQVPRLRIFCYGNEVHAFAGFRNHPAFIRIDTSPPQRGGMVDVEYCGVSKYELEYHPNVALTGIERFFRRIDFDVQIKDTRIHARYDKERASDARDLGEKIDRLFHLVPLLMDVDWVIGDLTLSEQARAQVAAAWAEFFDAWGVLPAPRVLTADRVGILCGMDPGPAGEREIRWSGSGPYRDLFTVDPPPGFWRQLDAAVARLAVEPPSKAADDEPVTQRRIDRHVLAPLRQMVARGELIASPAGFVPADADRFRRRHEAAVLATVLSSPDEVVAASAHMASLAAVLEPALRFETTGAINGYAVERASVPLLEESFALYVLRDAAGIPRLALSAGDVLCETRPDPGAEWRRHWSVDAAELAAALRRGNLTVAWLETARGDPKPIAGAVRRQFSVPNDRRQEGCASGERLLRGVKASPGRAVGLARLGVSGRHAEDVEGAVLVVPALTPQDQPFVYRSAAVVSTGGGVLSHAGLLALQFHKPALVVSGRWEQPDGGGPAVVYPSRICRETKKRIGPYEVSERYEAEGQERAIEDGDLLVVEGDAGTVRHLGQDCAALALHEDLRQLVAASRGLEAATAADALLALRGRALQARHQLERLLGRISDPVLARHAVAELLIGDAGRAGAVPLAIKAALMRRLVDNPLVGGSVREAVRRLYEDVKRRLAGIDAQARRDLPRVRNALEALALRLDVIHGREGADAVSAVLGACDIIGVPPTPGMTFDVDECATGRLAVLRSRLAHAVEHAAGRSPSPPRLRHRLRLLDRLDDVLGTPVGERQGGRLGARLAAAGDAAIHALAGARVLAPDGGIELRSLIGSKAANLAETRRLGLGRFVPPWFVVADRAFQEVLDAGPGPTLRESIDAILARPGVGDAQKARVIRGAWESVTLPEELLIELAAAYDALGRWSDDGAPFVAVRSSALEEDVETENRAGEFDTFLFVRGMDAVAAHLKLAWSGLWSERAIHSRSVLGLRGAVGGGVLVQRMADARAAGVLHTVNLAEGRLDEMVINVGLGLGEGIVSGAVAADLIVVSKQESLAARQLRFRYLTNDKRERVVFDARFGSGTVRTETLNRQRLRPSIEYVELCELVRAASRLEWAYGQPLDVEFAFEGTRLRVLQVRPLPAALAIWRATVERHPLATSAGRDLLRPSIAG